jgi:hypothetical protein
MEDIQDVALRVKELIKKKKEFNKKLRRMKKTQIKTRIAKRKVNEEIRGLRAKKNLFVGMSAEDAMKLMKVKMDGVSPSDMFPVDLEREFDKLDMQKSNPAGHKILDLGRIPEGTRASRSGASDDEGLLVHSGGTGMEDSETSIVGTSVDDEPAGHADSSEEVVLDFSDQ